MVGYFGLVRGICSGLSWELRGLGFYFMSGGEVCILGGGYFLFRGGSKVFILVVVYFLNFNFRYFDGCLKENLVFNILFEV